MNFDAEQMTAELADALASNDRSARIVDPRTVPLRFHHLRAMGRSAAHCYEAFQSDGEQTLALRLGAGTHADLFGQEIALWDRPAKTGNGKAPRNGGEWEKFKAENAGKIILNAKERAEARTLADAIRRDPTASRLLFSQGSICEQTILWEQDGRARRSTPDVYGRGGMYVVELKTTRDASPARFRWDVRRMAYHAQIADQCDAIEARTGIRPKERFIVAVEKSKPFVVQTYRLTENDLEKGQRILRAWLEAFRVAEDSNAWGGYSQTIIDVDLPDDDDLELTFGDEPDGDDESDGNR